MATDPVTHALARVTLGVLLRSLRDALPNNDKRVAEARQELLEDFVFEAREAVRQLTRRAALDEREARALFDRIAREAGYASTAERSRVLAHAVAGLFAPDIDSEMRSRVARAIVQLEPSDVVLLRNIEKRTTPIARRSPQADALEAAGCVVVETEQEGLGEALARAARRRRPLRTLDARTKVSFRLTALGVAVLASLRTWKTDGGGPPVNRKERAAPTAATLTGPMEVGSDAD